MTDPLSTPFRAPFASDDGFDFDVRLALGHSVHGGAEPGEVLAAVAEVAAGDHAKWFDAWLGLGERLLAQGDAAAAAGHRVTAAARLLRAANYLGFAVSAAAALDRPETLTGTFGRHRRAWTAFLAQSDLTIDEVPIAYDEAGLTGMLFTPEAPGPHRTLVLNNGSDEAVSRLWTDLGRPALARGWAVFVYDGPGQQSQLFEHGVPFRPDWEAVLTPVVDALRAHPDVDASRLAVWGVSQSGFWVPRALTAEHRFAAAVADPGVVDVSASWVRRMPAELLDLIRDGQDDTFDRIMDETMSHDPETAAMLRFRARPYGADARLSVAYRAVLDYRLTAEQAAKIDTPLLITDPEGEQFWPGQSATLAEWTHPHSTLASFRAADGAALHCQPMARAQTAEVGLDWLEDVVG
ncbi:alpha/beta fold hydrolase [Microbacterium awajiense]|uniref:Alpha/beta fold hydrolase n=1 Tax=Microbacterium awajiense TaxID=415214 RepID=A0ABP7ADB0_9MICO